jgi:phage host-nuclease inhibitor protein Gam
MVSRAKETHTANRVVRLGAEWDELAEAAGQRKRASVIKQLVQWYLRYPGVKLPERPPRKPPAE